MIRAENFLDTTAVLNFTCFQPEQLESALKTLEEQHVGFSFSLDGEPIWRWRNLYKIVSDLAMSLGTASVEILIVMGIAFRSLKLGVIAIIPNMIPLAAAGTFMAIFGWPLDVVSVCSFTVCLGIAVDESAAARHPFKQEVIHSTTVRAHDGAILDW